MSHGVRPNQSCGRYLPVVLAFSPVLISAAVDRCANASWCMLHCPSFCGFDFCRAYRRQLAHLQDQRVPIHAANGLVSRFLSSLSPCRLIASISLESHHTVQTSERITQDPMVSSALFYSMRVLGERLLRAPTPSRA